MHTRSIPSRNAVVVARPLLRLRLIALLLISCTTIASAQQSADTAKLNEDFFAAYEAKNWPEAIKLGQKLAAAAPADGGPAYNLACAYALSGDPESAMRWLSSAVDRGFADIATLRDDADFATIRKLPEFAKLEQRVATAAEKRTADFDKRVAQHPPLIVPPRKLDADQPAPVILVMHGYGSTAEDLAPVWRDVANERGAIFVSARAVNAAGQGFEWGTVDQADRIVQAALEVVRKKHKVDESRIVLSGFSQGGLMAYALAARHPQQFCGSIPVAARYIAQSVPLKPEDPPAKRPKFFIMVGSSDRVLEENRKANADLKAAGWEVQYQEYKGVGHAFPDNRDEELRKALDFVLPK